ncbi:MAG: MFS transporter [Pseudomonadales bacterium]
MAAHDIFAALKVRDFAMLWVGSLASSFAMNMQIIARGWLVYTLTESPLDLGWVTLSFMLPTVIFSLWGGALADRLHKRRIIVAAQLLNTLATLLMAAIVLQGHVTFWDFIWFGFFNGAVLALSMPARQAFVPELIPERLIFTAMALNTTSWNLSRIVGPALAGLLIAVLADGDTGSSYGVGILYLIIAALYFLSSLTMLGVSVPGNIKAADGKGLADDVVAGLHYVRGEAAVLALILLSLVPFMFGMTVNTLLPAFNQDVLGGGPEDLGFLVSTMGGGAIVGSLMMAAMGGMRRKGYWLLLSMLLWGSATLIFGLAQSFMTALGIMILIGWVSAWNMSLNRGLLLQQASAEMRGRILSIDMMSHGLMPLGVIPVTLVAEYTSVGTGIMFSGLAFLLATGALLLMPSVRQLDQSLAARPL